MVILRSTYGGHMGILRSTYGGHMVILRSTYGCHDLVKVRGKCKSQRRFVNKVNQTASMFGTDTVKMFTRLHRVHRMTFDPAGR